MSFCYKYLKNGVIYLFYIDTSNELLTVFFATMRSVRDMGHEFRTRTSSAKYNCVLIRLIW